MDGPVTGYYVRANPAAVSSAPDNYLKINIRVLSGNLAAVDLQVAAEQSLYSRRSLASEFSLLGSDWNEDRVVKFTSLSAVFSKSSQDCKSGSLTILAPNAEEIRKGDFEVCWAGYHQTVESRSFFGFLSSSKPSERDLADRDNYIRNANSKSPSSEIKDTSVSDNWNTNTVSFKYGDYSYVRSPEEMGQKVSVYGAITVDEDVSKDQALVLATRAMRTWQETRAGADVSASVDRSYSGNNFERTTGLDLGAQFSANVKGQDLLCRSGEGRLYTSNLDDSREAFAKTAVTICIRQP